MGKIAEAPILLEMKNSVKIGGATFPKRDGWDWDGSFSARSEGSGQRRWIFLLRRRVIADGYAGKNYRRGVVWTGQGYMDITFYVESGIWKTNDEVFHTCCYKSACSPMQYVEKWENKDLEKY